MAKPSITTRATKGSALTWTEGDANLENLRDATITLTAGSGGTAVSSELNGNITLVAGTNVTLSGDNAGKTVTINASAGATTLDGLSDVNTSGVLNNHVLKYNSTASEWQTTLLDVPTNLDSLTDVTISTPSDGQVLKYNTSLSRWENGTSSGGITEVVQDTSPTLGGDLDLGMYIITADSNDFIRVGNPTLMVGKTAWTSSVNVTSDQSNMYFGPDIANNYAGGAKMLLTKGVNGAVTINSEGTGNISLTPNGTGKVVTKNLNYNEGALYDLGTTGGTLAPNVANGNVQKVTLNSALTINAFTSPVAGQSLTLIIYGGTAYTSITSTMKFAGGVKTLTGTAGCIDILSVYYDGTNYFASLGKGFA